MKRRIFCFVMAIGLAAMLSACQSNQKAESIRPDRTEETTGFEESSDDGNVDRNVDGNVDGNENVEQVVPISVTIEHVNDTLLEESGFEIYRYPKFYLDEEDKNAYPELSKVFESYNSEMDSQKEALLEQLEKDYEEAAENSGDADAWHEMSIETTARTLRADSNVVSFLCEYDAALGGAHPYSYVYGMNYDAKTGKKLTLGDVVKDKDAFVELVSEAFDKDYSEEEYGELTNGGEALKECDFNSEDEVLWTIDPISVTIYFATYNLGTYVQGEQAVSIYFDQAPEIFDEHYMTACEDYALPVTYRKPLSILTDSGEREKICMEMDYTEYEEYETYKTVYIIGDTQIESLWECYDTDPYLVHVNGKNYIYAFQSAEGDWGYLSVVDADNKSLDDEKNTVVRLKIYSEYNDAQERYEYIQGGEEFTDPSQFTLRNEVDVLGTYDAYKNYHVGSDGYPVTDDALYLSGTDTAFRAIKDIECDTVDQKGNVTGKAVIPEGSYLAVVRTDGDSMADIQIIDPSCIVIPRDTAWTVYYLSRDMEELFDPNGTIYRVTVDKSEFKVNGEDETSLFEGILRSD